MKTRTPASTVILYIIGIIFLAVGAFMLVTAINYTKLYLASYEVTFQEMWSNSVQYIIEKCGPYFGLAVVMFGTGRAISAAVKGRSGDAAPAEELYEQSMKLEEMRQVGSIRLEEMEKREKVRIEETRNLILNDLDMRSLSRQNAEEAIMQRLADLEIALAGILPVKEGTEAATLENLFEAEEAPAEEVTGEAAGEPDAAEALVTDAAAEEAVETSDSDAAAAEDEDKPETSETEETEEAGETDLAAAEAEAAVEAEADAEVEADATAEAEEEASPTETPEPAAEDSVDEADASADEPTEDDTPADSDDPADAAAEAAEPDTGEPAAEEAAETAVDTVDTAEVADAPAEQADTQEAAGQAAEPAETSETAETDEAVEPDETAEADPAWDGKKDNLKVIEPAKQHRHKKGRKSKS